MPWLSIITINFNNSNGLEKTIKSVSAQSHKNFEYIIIDGNSNDPSKSVIEKYQSVINYWVSENDNGIYDAQNKGIAQAKGDYLLFLNSGDYLENDRVLEKVAFLNSKEDILYGELIFDFGIKEKKLSKLPSKLTTEYLFNNNIWHPSSFIKKSLFEKFGYYNTAYKIASDYDFFFKTIVSNKVSTLHLNFAVSVYDTTGLSSSEENLRTIELERKQIQKMYLNTEEYIYLDNVSRFKIRFLSKFLVHKPILTKVFDKLLQFYSKVRN